jgi:hypothetical protein
MVMRLLDIRLVIQCNLSEGSSLLVSTFKAQKRFGSSRKLTMTKNPSMQFDLSDAELALAFDILYFLNLNQRRVVHRSLFSSLFRSFFSPFFVFPPFFSGFFPPFQFQHAKKVQIQKM